MKVVVVGPNLPAQAKVKGTFAVHVVGCQDLGKLKKYIGSDTYADAVEVTTKRQVAEFIYDPESFEGWALGHEESFIADFDFAPCTKGLN